MDSPRFTSTDDDGHHHGNPGSYSSDVSVCPSSLPSDGYYNYKISASSDGYTSISSMQHPVAGNIDVILQRMGTIISRISGMSVSLRALTFLIQKERSNTDSRPRTGGQFPKALQVRGSAINVSIQRPIGTTAISIPSSLIVPRTLSRYSPYFVPAHFLGYTIYAPSSSTDSRSLRVGLGV